jgi:benzylsuccinate CoA-transferase BbsF subunit
MADLPLDGCRVLDFCWQAAGPLATELLANLGADVVKVETARNVDRVRQFHHPAENFSIDTGAFFQDCNTNKRSLTLDLHHPEAVALVKELLPRFDVVASNFAPTAMTGWGLGYEALRAVKRDIIVASFPVMGHTGPSMDWRAIGNGVTGLSGVAAHTGCADRPPVGLGTLYTDFSLAPIAATLIMAALLERERTGEGQFIEIAQYEAAIHLLDTELLDYLVNGETAPRRGNRSPEYVPHGVFPCRGEDRWVAIAVRNTLEWQQLSDEMERTDLALLPSLQHVEGRRVAEDELEAAITAWTEGLDAYDVAKRLQRRGVPAVALQSTADLVERDEGMRDFFAPFEHPTGVPFLVQHQPFTWDGERLPVSRAPMLGEHNEEILRGELGMDEERYVDLLLREVIY